MWNLMHKPGQIILNLLNKQGLVFGREISGIVITFYQSSSIMPRRLKFVKPLKTSNIISNITFLIHELNFVFSSMCFTYEVLCVHKVWRKNYHSSLCKFIRTEVNVLNNKSACFQIQICLFTYDIWHILITKLKLSFLASTYDWKG